MTDKRQSWSYRRVKFIANLNMGQSPSSELVTRFDKADGFPFLQGNAEFGEETPVPLHTCSVPAKVAKSGDLLVSVRAPVGALNIADQDYGIGRGLCAIRWNNLQARFGWWAMHHHRIQLAIIATGSTYVAVSAEDVANVTFAFPDTNSQKLISDYLDYEINHIDTLITEKNRMLSLLKEKRSGLVCQAVTRGIDPDVPLKPSRIDWLGDIPAHWETKRAKGLFREIDSRSVTGEEELLSLRMNVGLVPHNDVSDKVLEPNDLTGFKHVEPGQMVINRMRAASGLIAISPSSGLVSPDYAVFDIIDPDVNIDYFLALFTTDLVQAVFRSSSKGLGTGSSGFLRLYTENFLALHFPFPSGKEQQDIVDFLGAENIQATEVEVALRLSIELLKERRSALITAAVTGQIDPKDMAA